MHLAFLAPDAPGHVNPALPLVAELARREHRVTFATGRDMAAAAEAAGARALVLPTDVPPPPTTPGTFTPVDLARLLEGVLADQRVCLPLIDEHFRDDPPDVVCADMLDTTGRLLAHKLSVPDVALVTNLAGNSETPLADAFTGGEFDFAHPALIEVQRQMAEFAAANGIDEMPDPMSDAVAPLNLVFVPREFQPGAGTFDNRFHFIGPTLRERAQAEQWRPRDPGAPVLFVSLGTALNDRPEFFRMCVEAFRDGPWQVAMAVGDHASGIADLPANFEVRSRFPQLAVLRTASAFVSHAGMGSTMESLHSGVPMVCAPQAPEQATNANRVEELGLGRVLDDPTATGLRRAVDAVAEDEGIRARVDEMRGVLDRCGGASAGADAIETYVVG